MSGKIPIDISKSPPESPNGRMHKLGYIKYNLLARGGVRRHIYEKKGSIVELNDYSGAMKFCDKEESKL